MPLTENGILSDPSLYSKSRKNVTRIAILGDSKVGKTSIIERFVNGKFTSEYSMTVGVNVQTKKSPIGNQDSELFIFSDIAGQSQFLNLRKSYYAGIEIVLAVFDLTRKESLTNLENIWIPEFLNSNPLEEGLRTKIQLVGNKSDLKDSIEVTYADMEACVSRIMKRFSQTSFLRPFLMTSAKNNLYINQAFGYS